MSMRFDRAKRGSCCSLSLLLYFILSPRISQAQSPDANAYKLLAGTIGRYASGPVVLLHPGLLLDPIFDDTDRSTSLKYESLYNPMMSFSMLYTAAPIDLPAVYGKILTKAQWALVPLVRAQREELAKLHPLLYQNNGSVTSGYKHYLDKKKLRDDAVAQFENTPEGQRTAELEEAVRAAREDLEVDGRSNVYEPAEARFKLLSDAESLKWRDDDIHHLSAASAGFTSAPHTDTSPPIDKIDAGYWIQISMVGSEFGRPATNTELSDTFDSRTTRWWFWSGAEAMPPDCAQHLLVGDMSIHFDLAVIEIKRDWLDTKVFESQAWRWDDNTAVLSDGSNSQNTGSSPMFATAVLVARNLVITGPELQLCKTQIHDAIRNKRGLGFGPFMIAGNAFPSELFYLPGILTDSALYVPYFQIIGFVSTILPKVPNPNPDFSWPSGS